jgi:hypothetical protein
VVTVEDSIPPTVMVRNVIVPLDASGHATIAAGDIDAGSTDACGIASMSLSKSDFDCSDVGSHDVTLAVTDNHGNSGSAVAVVTIEDRTAPTIATQPVMLHRATSRKRWQQ